MTDRRHSEQPSRSVARRDATGLIGRVRQCWEEVLGPSSANAPRDFLSCGGDSLRALQLCQRLGDTLGRSVSPGWLLSTPGVDVAGLAAELAEAPVTPLPVSDARATATPSASAATTFSQERMWFMHQLAPAGLAYNVSQALRLTGPVQTEALEHAVRAVSARHPVLCSRFAATPEGLQCLAPGDNREIRLERLLAQTSAEEEPATALRETAERLLRTPFDLVRGPVFRAALIKAGDEDAVLLLWAHHIVADQWAFDILIRDIAKAYNAICDGRAADRVETALPLSAYATWHREWFRGERLRRELAYWRRKLRGLDPLVLPADHTRPPQQSFRGRRLRRALAPALRDRLRSIAADQGATLAVLLLAAFKLLLRAHTDRTDITVGVPVANRQHPGAGSVVGTLVNTLVVRTELARCADTVELIAAVRDSLVEALEHQDLPFEQLVQALEVPRDTATSPLFTVMFNMLNTPLGEVHFQALEWSRFELDRQAAQFDLTVTIDAEFDHSIVFEYATDLFESETIDRLATRYFHLLEHLDTHPRHSVDAQLCITAQELALIKTWERGPQQEVSSPTVVDLIERALDRPEGASLEWEHESLDSRMLEQRSRVLARRLQNMNVGPGQRVGICLSRSPALLIAMLGILRTGAAYVPLDPHYPVQRLQFMAQDADLIALVGDPETTTSHRWPEIPRLVLNMYGELEGIDSREATATSPGLTRPHIHGDDPAYVIYTSGTTGEPKGVVVRQVGVVNFLLTMAVSPGLEAQDRLLAVTTPSFDIAVLELLLPLIAGATIVLAPQESLNNGEALQALLVDGRITVMQATPSTWRVLIDSGWTGCATLKALVGGEALSNRLANALASRAGEVWNMYGPTETTVWSSTWRLPPAPVTRVVLGRPVSNTTIRILDSATRRCPIGVPGEIFIGGAGLADGYLNRQDLTEERFILDPVDPTGQARLYRTGDLGRWLEDGTLEHLGRIDTQVKLRGHRIELGEIERTLESHARVAGAVAHVATDASGDERLIAYVVPWGTLPGAGILRDHLRATLPEYMLPQHFVELDAIPLLPNGKIDRNHLPEATAERIAGNKLAAEALPVTPLEKALAQLWTEVLGVQPVGRHQRFFELGGHSMLAVRLVNYIREALGYRCTVTDLFRYDTIATVAELLETAQAADDDCAIALQPLGTLPALFCLTGVSVYRGLAASLGTERPLYGLSLASEGQFAEAHAIGDDTAPATIEAMATRDLDLIRQRQPKGPYHLLGFSMGGAVALEVAHLLCEAGEQVTTLILIDTDLPGGARGPLRHRLRQWMHQARTRLTDLTARQSPKSGRRERTGNPYVAAIAAYRGRRFTGPTLFVEAGRAHRPAGDGWETLVPRVKIISVDAEHDALLQPPAVDEIARIIESALADGSDLDTSHSGTTHNAS